MCKVDLSSQYQVNAESHEIPNSFIKPLNHMIFEPAKLILLFSTSADDLETMTCFFTFQETNESPNLTQYPIIDLLLSKQLA